MKFLSLMLTFFFFLSVNSIIGHSHLHMTIFSLRCVTPSKTHWLKIKCGNIWHDYTSPQSLYRQSGKRYISTVRKWFTTWDNEVLQPSNFSFIF